MTYRSLDSHSTTNTPPQLAEVLAVLRAVAPELAKRWGVRPLAVFGSVARGDATPDSDIDILFDYDTPLGWDLADVGDFLEARLGRRVDLLSRQAIRPRVWPFIKGDMRYV